MVFTLTPAIRAGALGHLVRPFDGANVHWTLAMTPSHLAQGRGGFDISTTGYLKITLTLFLSRYTRSEAETGKGSVDPSLVEPAHSTRVRLEREQSGE